MKKVLAKVDEARLGRAVAGLLDGSLRVEDVIRDGRGISAEVRGTRDSYSVYFRGRVITCSCPDHRVRGSFCKHIAAVALHELAVFAKARSTRRSIEQVRF